MKKNNKVHTFGFALGGGGRTQLSNGSNGDGGDGGSGIVIIRYKIG